MSTKPYSNYLNPQLCGQEWRYSPALARLNELRRRADEYNERYQQTGPHDWKSVRFAKYPGANRGVYSEDRTKFYIDNLDDWPGRQEGDAHKIVNLRHTGWWADNYQNDILKGAVVSIHTRNGRRYYPATYCSGWDGATVYLNEGTDDKEQAARWADQNAEREAEDSRESYAKDAAEQEIIEKREEIHATNKEALALIKEIKGNQYTPAVCAAIKHALRDHLDTRRQAFDRITELEDDYWRAVPNW